MTKAELLEQANYLRRHATELQRRNRGVFLDRVNNIRGGLFAAGVLEPEIQDLLPDALYAVETCRLRPLGDHVVVLPTQAKDVTEGGIIVPETAKEKPMQGTVLAVGPGRIEPSLGTVLPAVSVGDVVLFGRYSGLAVDLDGQAVLVMREEDILGTLAPEVS